MEAKRKRIRCQIIKGDVTRDDLQRRFFNATHQFNIVATLFRMVATLFQHCYAVLSKKKTVVANRPV